MSELPKPALRLLSSDNPPAEISMADALMAVARAVAAGLPLCALIAAEMRDGSFVTFTLPDGEAVRRGIVGMLMDPEESVADDTEAEA